MSRCKDLKNAKNLSDVAIVLGYKPSALAYIIYKIPHDERYTQFGIPKKNGSIRLISAPNRKLKKLQRRLAELLYECIDEYKPTEEKESSAKGNQPSRNRARRSISHGFQRGLSIASNAEEHIRKRYVFNIDIADFFPSFNFGRVRGFFIKNHIFRLEPKVATILAQISCHENKLPQGSPSSPVISNLIAKILDVHLVRIARKAGCTYTRYADDLTFSTNKKKFPKSIASKKFLSKNKWIVGPAVRDCIKTSGFKINSRKTHMQYRDSRQVVTGLVVNRVVNTERNYYRSVRSMCNSLFNYGFFTFPEPVENGVSEGLDFAMLFQDIYRKMFQRTREVADYESVNEDIEKKINTGSIQQLEGMLSHIYHIKNYRNKFANQGYRKTRHDGIKKGAEKSGSQKYPPLNRSNEYKHESHLVSIDGIKNLYLKFLFFKHFYNLDKPLLIFEGKTDYVYLKCALAKLHSNYPALVGKDGERIDFKVRNFNRTRTVNEMLKLAEGASGMLFLMLEYERLIEKYRCEGKRHPVIMIVDNDKDGENVLKAADSRYGKTKSAKKNHLVDNLFLFAIPRIKGKAKTVIEDYFEDDVLKTELDGKKYNPSNRNIDTTREYGKNHFSQYVVKSNQETINFDGFKPLLNEISETITAYYEG